MILKENKIINPRPFLLTVFLFCSWSKGCHQEESEAKAVLNSSVMAVGSIVNKMAVVKQEKCDKERESELA